MKGKGAQKARLWSVHLLSSSAANCRRVLLFVEPGSHHCGEDQFEQEFMGVIDLYKKYFDLFGIDKYVMRLSLHGKQGLGKKYVDNESLWIKTSVAQRDQNTWGQTAPKERSLGQTQAACAFAFH